MHLICLVTLQDHLVEESCTFMGWGSLRYVTTLIRFMVITIVIMEICPMTSREYMFKGLYEFMDEHVMFGDHLSSASGDIKNL